ncbi:hypothetical protein DWUX_2300 [Desulfovibrio diazotrophicus]|nr:hypothetical protein DWUX_2300 [Desulfovibrio diazotrophicus]
MGAQHFPCFRGQRNLFADMAALPPPGCGGRALPAPFRAAPAAQPRPRAGSMWS